MPAGHVGALVVDRLAGKQRGIKEGPEPRHKEHHLRGDEHDHAVAVMDLHDAGVIAGLRLMVTSAHHATMV